MRVGPPEERPLARVAPEADGRVRAAVAARSSSSSCFCRTLRGESENAGAGIVSASSEGFFLSHCILVPGRRTTTARGDDGETHILSYWCL